MLNCVVVYGALGQYTCLYYNVYVSSTITTQGQSCISAAGLFFESFLNNNVHFASLNEVIQFIDNVCQEKNERQFKDRDWLDRDITIGECFYKLMTTCGFDFVFVEDETSDGSKIEGFNKYIPSQEDLEIVWDILCDLPQEDINRLFYKNNLFGFMENPALTKCITLLLSTLNVPFLDPNKPPKEIQEELDFFCDLLYEYVYYHHQIIDRMERYRGMRRSVCAITDTDSTMPSVDGWYRFVLDKVKDVDMTVKHERLNAFTFLNKDEFGDPTEYFAGITFEEPDTEYDFYNDEIIEMQKALNPIEIIPQESLRYSIVNIMGYCATKLSNDYMKRYTMNSNSYQEGQKCLMILKNEFLFKRTLLMLVKKSYASDIDLQEGNQVKGKARRQVKGMMITKSSLQKSTRDRLQDILFEEILNSPNIDRVKILKELGKFENEIFQSLNRGEKKYYKPAKIKSASAYENPMRIQGIKGSVVWNALKEDNAEPIDLDTRNSVDIVKIDINNKNIGHLQTSNPEVYKKIMSLLNTKAFEKGIEGISIPKDQEIPKYLLEFINYNQLINDNISAFPLEPIHIYRGNAANNFTNIVKL